MFRVYNPDKENKYAKIVADEDQISLMIGKNGQNIKLASKLTGYEIDVERKGYPPKVEEENKEEKAEAPVSDGESGAENEDAEEN